MVELNPFELYECKELPDVKNDWGEYGYEYKDLLKSITDKVNWVVEGGFEGYQGDFFYLGIDKQRYIYFVVGGYGSCSGCDALQGANTYEELLKIRDDLKRDIRKFDNLKEFEQWFNTVGQTEWYGDNDVKDFIKKANERYSINLQWR